MKNAIGIVGWKNSGKTTLIKRLVSALTSDNISVATIKHAHHDFDIDQPGRDSHEHRLAGAIEVLISSQRRWAHINELDDNEKELKLSQLIDKIEDSKLIIIEGFKKESHEKLEIHRRENNKPLLYNKLSNVVAIVSDDVHKDVNVPVFAIDDIASIVNFIRKKFNL